jgi:hypothetical protein
LTHSMSQTRSGRTLQTTTAKETQTSHTSTLALLL